MTDMQLTPAWPIYKQIMKCVEAYTGLPDCKNERYEKSDYPQNIYILSDMAKLQVLREFGDIKLYLNIDQQIDTLTDYKGNKARQLSTHDLTIRNMMQWLDAEIDGIRPYKTNSTRQKVVLSLLIWGKTYAEKMLGSMFKSLMADGNIPSLVKEKFVIIHCQTDAATKEVIEASPIAHKMKELGVHFHYAVFPDSLTPYLNGDSAIYWMVGAGATAALHYAKKNGAAFHHSYPDIIYSNNYFSELARLSKEHNSIVGPAHRADESMFIPSLESYDKDGVISVPSADLASLHFNALHMSAYYCMVNHRPKFWSYPENHVMMWESTDNIHFNCPHLNALWLAPHVIKDLPDRFFMSLDSELDLICKGEDFYIPQENDELYLVEFSEQARYQVKDNYVDAFSAGRWMWNTITHRDLLKFFIRGMKVKLNRDLRPMPSHALPEVQITAEKNFLFNAMMSTDIYAGIKLARSRSHEGRIFAFSA